MIHLSQRSFGDGSLPQACLDLAKRDAPTPHPLGAMIENDDPAAIGRKLAHHAERGALGQLQRDNLGRAHRSK
jgi:hypothetical protein